MESIYIPTLHSFAMNNVFTGSSGLFRFKITPSIKKIGKEVDFENSSLYAEYWHGNFCYEKSEIEGDAMFPLSMEGRQAMLDWLCANV